jgi:hypothetical protein
MVKTYIYQVLGNDCYKVVRIDDKYPRGNKERYKEYLVDLKQFTCDCKHFYFRQTPCHHMWFVLSQLIDGGGILSFEKEGDYDRLIDEVKKNETRKNA